MVQCVKRCLKKILGNARLTFDELLTTVVEVKGTLNSRPLTYDYDEVGSESLTMMWLVRRVRTRLIMENDFSIWLRKNSTFGIGGGRSIWLI